MLKGEGVYFVVANFLVLESFVLTTVYIGQATSLVNLQQDKCYSLFCNFLSLYDGQVLYL